MLEYYTGQMNTNLLKREASKVEFFRYIDMLVLVEKGALVVKECSLRPHNIRKPRSSLQENKARMVMMQALK